MEEEAITVVITEQPKIRDRDHDNGDDSGEVGKGKKKKSALKSAHYRKGEDERRTVFCYSPKKLKKGQVRTRLHYPIILALC